jgi:hydrogenase maturation factor
MCQAAVGKVVKVGKKSMTVDYKGKLRELRSKLVDVKEGDYVQFTLDIVIDKVDPEEAKLIMGEMK